MDDEVFSFVIYLWRDPKSKLTYINIIDVNTGKAVQLENNSFLLRFTTTGKRPVMRCQIRHLASNKDTHLQSGSGLRNFARDCLPYIYETSTPTDESQ